MRMSSFCILQYVRDLFDIKHIDMCDTGVMRPYLAHKICWFCKNLKTFYLITFRFWDADVTKVSWYVLVKHKYSHVELTEKIVNKVEEYMRECKAVRDHAMLDD